MTEKGKKYLSDILQAIELIEDFSSNTSSFTAYQADLKTKSAIERQLGIIGEAVNKFRNQMEDFELPHTRLIVDFRNRLIHSYDNLDDSIVWAILKNHLPALKSEVEEGLQLKADN